MVVVALGAAAVIHFCEGPQLLPRSTAGGGCAPPRRLSRPLINGPKPLLLRAGGGGGGMGAATIGLYE